MWVNLTASAYGSHIERYWALNTNIFKATFGGSFGSLSFGNVAQSNLPEPFVLGDLTVVGSLARGGDLGNVDLIYVPEPAGAVLLLLGLTFTALAASTSR